MALGSTQPLVKMSTRNILGGKGGRCVRLITSPPSSAECHKIWKPKPPGTLWATRGLLRDSFTFLLRITRNGGLLVNITEMNNNYLMLFVLRKSTATNSESALIILNDFQILITSLHYLYFYNATGDNLCKLKNPMNVLLLFCCRIDV